MDSNKNKFVLLLLVCMVAHAWASPWRLWWWRPRTPPPPPPTQPQPSPPPPPPPPPPPSPTPSPSPAPTPSHPPPPPTPPLLFPPPHSQDPADCWDALTYVDSCIRDLIASFFGEDVSLQQNCCVVISELSDSCFDQAFTGFTDTEFNNRVRAYCARQYPV